jgi:hypothetical protein
VYFIKDKNTLGIQKKVTTVLRPLQAKVRVHLVVHRTDSEQEVQSRRLSPPSDILQLRLRHQSTTSIYYPALQSLLPISAEDPPTTTAITTDYRGRSAYHVYYYYRRYRGCLHLQSQELREVSFQELLILYENTRFLQPRLRRIISY